MYKVKLCTPTVRTAAHPHAEDPHSQEYRGKRSGECIYIYI